MSEVSVRQRLRPAPFRGEVLKALVRKALARMGTVEADLRILVVGDADMERWNREFLGHVGTTNVISFPEDEADGARVAGDILVSAPTCLNQTEGWPGTPEERVFFFIVHGLLHLSGYDHVTGKAQARRMRRRELSLYRAVVGGPGL